MIPFAKDEISVAIVTYKQNNYIVLEKTVQKTEIEDLGAGASMISYGLTQLQSLCFEDDSEFTIQVNILTKSGSRHTSSELKGSNGIQYVREVIKNG
jgi:hypothetical protein